MIRKKLGDNEKGVKRIATQGNYSNIRKKLNDDEKATKRVNTLGGPQNVSIISESGLYRLIMRSKIGSPEAGPRYSSPLQGGGETPPPYRRWCPTHLHHSRGLPPYTLQIAPHSAGMGFVRDRSQKPECGP